MKSSWVLLRQQCNAIPVCIFICVVAYAVHRDSFNAHTCLALDASQHHKKQDITVVITPRTPIWQSLHVKMLLKTCLHVLLSCVHHKAWMHAGWLNLSAPHMHSFRLLSRLSVTWYGGSCGCMSATDETHLPLLRNEELHLTPKRTKLLHEWFGIACLLADSSMTAHLYKHTVCGTSSRIHRMFM